MKAKRGKAPYSPGWINRLIDWIDKRRIPSWLTYFVIYVLGVVYVTVSLLPETLNQPLAIYDKAIINAIWIPFPLACVHYLIRYAERVVDKFRSELACSPEEVELIRFRMTTIPQSVAVVILLVVGIFIYVDTIWGSAAAVGGKLHSPLARILIPLYASIGISFTPLLIYLTIRQIYFVNYLYRRVKEVDIFNLQPLYIPATLTARLGIIWLLYISANLITSGATRNLVPTFYLMLASAQILTALIAFLLPLWGIHRKILQQKQRLLHEHFGLVKRVYDKFQHLFQVEDYEAIDKLTQSVDMLKTFKAELEKVPTWPWRTETLQGFLSAIFLPIFLWLIQYLLDQYL
jgi:preprotein translocase subunit SecE